MAAISITGPERPLSSAEFVGRFTLAERVAIRLKARTHDDVADWWELVGISGSLLLSDEWVTDGMDNLVSLSVLTSGRATEILT